MKTLLIISKRRLDDLRVRVEDVELGRPPGVRLSRNSFRSRRSAGTQGSAARSVPSRFFRKLI